MTKINIVYDEMYNDVDIISVPDEIASSMNDLAKLFLDWTPPESDSDYWVTINGKRCLSIETVGFVKWLNNHCCLYFDEKVCIVAQHTNYCKEYQTIDF